MKVLDNPWVFLDLEIEDNPVGRIIFELFFDTCQKTCENFRCLCTGEKGIGKITGKPLHYKGVLFHKIVPGCMVQSGDFSEGNGRGGESIYGGYFDDESFDLKHNEPFLLSMASTGKSKNGSQFSITTQPAPHLDGVQVVFGRVVSGSAVVKQIESQKTDLDSRPLKECKIVNCGELPQVKKARKRHKKRSVSVDSCDLSSASVSEDRKGKKKKKKRKKEKKKRKKKKRYSLSESPSKEDNSAKKGTVTADEVPTVPSNKFLYRVDSKDNDRSSCIEDLTPPSQRSQSKRWTSKSGRKIKGRGSLRYRTPSRSRSRSSLERPYSVTPDRAGSDTPPHWRQAQKGQRPLVNFKKSPVPEDKWRQDSNSSVDRARNDGWDSDVDSKQKSSTGCWSGEESDERGEVVAAMVRRHIEKKLSNTFDDGLFGPVTKPNVKKNSRAISQKKSKTKQGSPETKDVTRSKWDTPERQSISPSIDKDDLDVDECSKGSGNGRVVSGVLGYEKLLEPQKLRRKHKKKKKIRETHKKRTNTTQNQKKVGKESKHGTLVPSKHRSNVKTKSSSATSNKVILSGGSSDSSQDRERQHYQRKRSSNNRKRSKHRRSSTSSYSSRTSSNEYRRRKRQRRYSFSDNNSAFSVSSHRSSRSFSERYSSSSIRKSSSRSEDSRSHLSMVSSKSSSDFSGENSSLSTPVSRKNKVDVESSVSHNKALSDRNKKLRKKGAKTSSKSSQLLSVSNEKKKKPRKEPQLSWQPPLEFGEEIEEEIVKVKVENKKQKKNVSEIKEAALKDKGPAKRSEAISKNGDTSMAEDVDDIDALLSSALDVQEPNKTTRQKIDVKQKLLLLQQATGKETPKPKEATDHTTTFCNETKENALTSNHQPANSAPSTTDAALGGFGFIPKYEPPTPQTPPKVVIKTIKSPSPEKQVHDVGIWSDEESEKSKTEPRKKLSKSSPSAEEKVSTSPKTEKVIHDRAAEVKQETLQVTTASPVLPNPSVLESKATNYSEKTQDKGMNVEKEDNDTEENDLLVHEPVATSKKPFVFNIKLPKTESEPSKPKKKRKKQKKLNKKHKTNKEKEKTSATVSTKPATSANNTATVTITAISTPSTTSPATSASMTSVTCDIITNTAQSHYPPPNMHVSHPPRTMGPYNPYYPTPHPYMGPRSIVPPGHMYPHHFHSQFMGFHQGHPPLPVGMGFQPELPDDNAPPLPSENEPTKPPEPAYDSQRLSDQKVAAMFASHDITKENVEKFFDDDKNLSDIPSPASSRSSSLFRKRRRRKRHHRSHRHRSYSSTSSWESSSRSRRSYSSDSSSYSPSGRRGRGRSFSSSKSSYRSRSYSSDRSFRGRSRRRSRYSRSHSYFSSSSSRDRRRSTSSSSSSGSDIDRPCRHYRPGRRHRSRYSSYERSSDRSDVSRLSSRTRYSRSWSRDRSLSRSSMSSRYTHSD